MINHLRITVSVLLALGLALLAVPAWALGLGQIEVKSQRDQPLLAEIPVISADPAELRSLQARLASPDTFARIGLPLPQGVVSDLQFSVGTNDRGQPVIRVTSPVPVQQPLLTFLVEVDWGQGRLVREYSALLDTPQTTAAVSPPPIDEAVVSDPNTVIRLPDPEPVTDPVAEADPSVPEQPTPETSVPEQTPELPSPPPRDTMVATQPEPAPTPTRAPEPEPEPVVRPSPENQGGSRTVRRGDTLSGIAANVDGGQNLNQTLIALLRANPDAFIGDNIHRLRAGAVLRIPDADIIATYSADEAALVVREQTAQWRGTRRALAQPPGVAGVAAGRTEAQASKASNDRTAAARRTTQARLEIVPPSASDARRAGTRSGISAGGEGDMLRQQEIQETQETLAARTAEVEELKLRVSELEKLQQQQQQLISMKDSELAAAQQRLATSQTAADVIKPSNTGFGPWMGIGAGLLTIGLLAAWWLNRRSRNSDVRRVFDPESLAAAIPVANAASVAAGSAATSAADDNDFGTVSKVVDSLREPAIEADSIRADATDVDVVETDRDDRDLVQQPDADVAAFDENDYQENVLHEPTAEIAISEVAATSTATSAEPAWNRLVKTADTSVQTAKPDADVPLGDAPTWHAGGADIAPLNPAPAGQSRIDLARAYLNMGDRDTARSLLREVALHGDTAAARFQASRMLDELF